MAQLRGDEAQGIEVGEVAVTADSRAFTQCKFTLTKNDSTQSVLIQIAFMMAQIEEENISNKPQARFFHIWH